MSTRVSNSVEKNVVNVPFPPVVLAANVAKDVLADISTINGEFAGRYIQNVGQGIVYYAIGHTCDVSNFNGILAGAPSVDANGFGAGQQIDISNVGQKISCFSVAGSTVAITLLKRNDLAQGTGGILSSSTQNI